MKLSDYLAKERIVPELSARTKPEVLAELIATVGDAAPGFDPAQAKEVLMEREYLGTTGIGDGVAIPHGKMESLDQILLVVGRSTEGVDFEALDFKLCNIFFLVLAPEQVAGMHLRILAHISRLLKDEAFRRSFLEADGRDALWDILSST